MSFPFTHRTLVCKCTHSHMWAPFDLTQCVKKPEIRFKWISLLCDHTLCDWTNICYYVFFWTDCFLMYWNRIWYGWHVEPTPKINRLSGKMRNDLQKKNKRQKETEKRTSHRRRQRRIWWKIELVSIIGAQTTSYRLICWTLLHFDLIAVFLLTIYLETKTAFDLIPLTIWKVSNLHFGSK